MHDELGHRFSISDAATATGTSPSTIKRRLRAGGFPNAERSDTGAWSIALADLLAAGFTVGAPAGPDQDQVQDDPRPESPDTVVIPLGEYLDLRESRARLAEVVGERDALRQLLTRALPAPVADHEPPATAVTEPPATVPRRRWWGRRR